MRTVFGRKNKSAVSPVIGTILMVAITVVLAAVLYVMVAGLGPGQQSIPPAAVLSAQGWASSGSYTNFSFQVTTVTPSGAQINPTALQYIVSNSAQTTMYSGAANASTTAGGFTINVKYSDDLDAGRVSAGDKIQISVTPIAGNPLVGGKLQVNYNGASLASGSL